MERVAIATPWWQGLAAGPGRWLAAPAWAIYRPLIAVRNRAYDAGWLATADLGAPTISIGNLTVGGTGKTPLVALVAAEARAAGRDPAVLSRGYGAAAGEANDEARMLGLPAFCHPDRRHAAALALAAGHDCLILDDGFQHRRARRDLDLVLIDATRPWGSVHPAVLPLGLLREPRRGLARADALIVTRIDAVPAADAARLTTELARYGKPVWRCRHRAVALIALTGNQETTPDTLAGRRVVLASGLGNPAGFERLAAALGWDVVASLRFPDHHAYAAGDLVQIADAARRHRARVVMTEKDAVKLRAMPEVGAALGEAAVLRVAAELEPDDRAPFAAAIRGVLISHGPRPSRPAG